MNRRKIVACHIAFGEVGVKERVKNVMNYKKPAFWIILIAVPTCIVVAVCFLISQKKEYHLPWDQFCASAEGNEIILTAEQKKYVAKLVNRGTWAEDAEESEWDYKFCFAEQTVMYNSHTGVFSDNMKKKSMTASETERQEINRILGILPYAIHVTSAGNPDSDLSGRTEEKNIDTLKQLYPEYFGLSTMKGLEVYVWQMAANSYSFGVLSGTNRLKTNEELWNLKGVTASEMKAILSTYDIGEEMIAVIPFQHIFSSYIADYWISEIGESESSIQSRRKAYIGNIRSMLFDD